jgi:uncharacterized protein (TIGR00299 family) protein
MVALKTLYFDCFSGAAGDMILGALIDAGVPLGEVRRALGSLAVEPDVVWTERVTRAGVSATRFCVRGEDEGHDHHGHDLRHQHVHGGDARGGPAPTSAAGIAAAPPRERGPHVHRSLREIRARIDGSALSAEARRRAQDLFDRLGAAEAAIHGTTMDQVHLHEVGALDSIVDVVGSVFAMEWLGVERVIASPLNLGGGTVRSAHGVYPVPAPATLRLLEGVPVYSGPQQVELVTPTGALLVTGFASAFGPIPAMRVRQTGYGAGSRDLPGTPNVLRVLVGDSDAAAPANTVVLIEAEIDDMNPQIFGVLMDRLLAEGALDVFYTPIQMKKNRPGTLLSVIAAPAARPDLTGIIFRETTTIGVRYSEMARECLDREITSVETPFGPIRVKVARLGGGVVNTAPEFDDCVRIARERQVPVKDVQAAAIKAFLDQRGR